MYNQENELKHYGVLGMKWGRRRQLNRAAALRKREGDSRSRRAIRNELRNDSRLRNKFARRYGVDSKTVQRVDRQGIGKTAAKAFTLGSYGALKYDQSRARGNSRGESVLNTYGRSVGNSLTVGGLSAYDGAKSRSANKYSDKTKALKSDMMKAKKNYKIRDKAASKAVSKYMNNQYAITKSGKAKRKELNDRMWAEGEKTYRARNKYKNTKKAYKQSRQRDKAQWREFKRNTHV